MFRGSCADIRMGNESDMDYDYDYYEYYEYYDYDEDETPVAQIYFVAYNVVASIIITIGILGNVVGLVVLTRPNMKVRVIHPPTSVLSLLLRSLEVYPSKSRIKHVLHQKTFFC